MCDGIAIVRLRSHYVRIGFLACFQVSAFPPNEEGTERRFLDGILGQQFSTVVILHLAASFRLEMVRLLD